MSPACRAANSRLSTPVRMSLMTTSRFPSRCLTPDVRMSFSKHLPGTRRPNAGGAETEAEQIAAAPAGRPTPVRCCAHHRQIGAEGPFQPSGERRTRGAVPHRAPGQHRRAVQVPDCRSGDCKRSSRRLRAELFNTRFLARRRDGAAAPRRWEAGPPAGATTGCLFPPWSRERLPTRSSPPRSRHRGTIGRAAASVDERRGDASPHPALHSSKA